MGNETGGSGLRSPTVDIDRASETFVVGWVPQPDDYRVFLKRPAIRRQRLRVCVMALVPIALGGVLAADGNWLGGTIAITAGGLLLLYTGVLIRRVLSIRWRNDPMFRDPMEFSFDATGVSRRQPDLSIWWGWSRVTGYEEQDSAFVLRFDSRDRPALGPVQILPKRAMPDPAQQSQLRAILDAHATRF